MILPDEKLLELQRLSEIILATIDYLTEQLGGSLVFDQLDIVADHYEREKLQLKKNYRLKKLDKLQAQLANLIKGRQHRVDLNFAGYIKEKTGYDIDIFEDLRNRVAAIVVQKEIRNQDEQNDIATMLHFYQQTSADEEVQTLNNLLSEYAKTLGKNDVLYTETIKTVEKDGKKIVTQRISTNPKPKNQQEAISPDGKRRLLVTPWGEGEHASTSVTIIFPTASGGIYAIHGNCPDLTALWKNNSTIVIATKKDYQAFVQCKQVRSFDDLIAIEYVES